MWLDVAASEPPQRAKPGYAIVEGRYDPDSHGHLWMSSGAFTQSMVLQLSATS